VLLQAPSFGKWQRNHCYHFLTLLLPWSTFTSLWLQGYASKAGPHFPHLWCDEWLVISDNDACQLCALIKSLRHRCFLNVPQINQPKFYFNFWLHFIFHHNAGTKYKDRYVLKSKNTFSPKWTPIKKKTCCTGCQIRKCATKLLKTGKTPQSATHNVAISLVKGRPWNKISKSGQSVDRVD
jgi:hypothetical protein